MMLYKNYLGQILTLSYHGTCLASELCNGHALLLDISQIPSRQKQVYNRSPTMTTTGGQSGPCQLGISQISFRCQKCVVFPFSLQNFPHKMFKTTSFERIIRIIRLNCLASDFYNRMHLFGFMSASISLHCQAIDANCNPIKLISHDNT